MSSPPPCCSPHSGKPDFHPQPSPPSMQMHPQTPPNFSPVTPDLLILTGLSCLMMPGNPSAQSASNSTPEFRYPFTQSNVNRWNRLPASRHLPSSVTSLHKWTLKHSYHRNDAEQCPFMPSGKAALHRCGHPQASMPGRPWSRLTTLGRHDLTMGRAGPILSDMAKAPDSTNWTSG